MRGGYQIVDLKGVNITTENVTIKGVHNQIENSHQKPLMFNEIMISGLEFGSRYPDAITNEGGSYNVYFALKPSAANGSRGYYLTITSDDEVKATAY